MDIQFFKLFSRKGMGLKFNSYNNLSDEKNNK